MPGNSRANLAWRSAKMPWPTRNRCHCDAGKLAAVDAVLHHGFIITLPIGSMYAIYGNIYHQYTPNVSIYSIHGSYGLCSAGRMWLAPTHRTALDGCSDTAWTTSDLFQALDSSCARIPSKFAVDSTRQRLPVCFMFKIVNQRTRTQLITAASQLFVGTTVNGRNIQSFSI